MEWIEKERATAQTALVSPTTATSKARRTSPGADRKHRRASALAIDGGKQRRRRAISASAKPPSTGTPSTALVGSGGGSSSNNNEDEHVDIDIDDGYIPANQDMILERRVREKLSRPAHHWRGVSALDSLPQETNTTLQTVPSSSVRPPAFAVHASRPIPSSTLIAPYTSKIVPSSTYLADPLNAYAHLGMPKPFVHFVGDVALDARGRGNHARFIRSGCHPNAVLRPLLCGDSEQLSFGVFATRDLHADEEIILGWEWDDGNAVHKLPALIESPGLFSSPFHRQHYRLQMANILHALESTFTTCACGTNSRECVLKRMEAFVDGRETEVDKVDLGPLVGVERGFRTRERQPSSSGMSGVERVDTKGKGKAMVVDGGFEKISNKRSNLKRASISTDEKSHGIVPMASQYSSKPTGNGNPVPVEGDFCIPPRMRKRRNREKQEALHQDSERLPSEMSVSPESAVSLVTPPDYSVEITESDNSMPPPPSNPTSVVTSITARRQNPPLALGNEGMVSSPHPSLISPSIPFAQMSLNSPAILSSTPQFSLGRSGSPPVKVSGASLKKSISLSETQKETLHSVHDNKSPESVHPEEHHVRFASHPPIVHPPFSPQSSPLSSPPMQPISGMEDDKDGFDTSHDESVSSTEVRHSPASVDVLNRKSLSLTPSTPSSPFSPHSLGSPISSQSHASPLPSRSTMTPSPDRTVTRPRLSTPASPSRIQAHSRTSGSPSPGKPSTSSLPQPTPTSPKTLDGSSPSRGSPSLSDQLPVLQHIIPLSPSLAGTDAPISEPQHHSNSVSDLSPDVSPLLSRPAGSIQQDEVSSIRQPTPTSLPTPKVKTSFQDYIMRKKKRKEEELAAVHSPETTNAMLVDEENLNGDGTVSTGALTLEPEASLDKNLVLVEHTEPNGFTEGNDEGSREVNQSLGNPLANGKEGKMRIDGLYGTSTNALDGSDTGNTSPMDASAISRPSETRPDDSYPPLRDERSLLAKSEYMEEEDKVLSIPDTLHSTGGGHTTDPENALGKESEDVPSTASDLVINRLPNSPVIKKITTSLPPSQPRSLSRPASQVSLEEEGEITSSSPYPIPTIPLSKSQPQTTSSSPFVRAHSPPTQPRSFTLMRSSSPYASSPSIPPQGGRFRRPPPPADLPAYPNRGRPLPSAPRALRLSGSYAPPPAPRNTSSGGTYIPRGPSADRDRMMDRDRDRSWVSGSLRGRGRGGAAGWMR